MSRRWQGSRAVTLFMLLAAAGCGSARFEQHDEAAPLRTLAPRYNSAFFRRHPDAYRFSAAIHYAHGKAHDDLQLSPLANAGFHDAAMDADYVRQVHYPPRIEPGMMLWGPYTGQSAWLLYRAIDWTHHHHEMTYDVLSARSIPWRDKQAWTERAVKSYLQRDREAARSPAVLEMTMRRAAVLGKPYFGTFRNKYPRANDFFYVAHWWHPVIYEAMMIAGNDHEQDQAVAQTHAQLYAHVLDHRPQRMLLSREAMPRYSRMSPESANIFDNLHMLHGIAYDIMAYEGWTMEEKRKELYRVIRAMANQPGDEQYVRAFEIPHPDMDPREYPRWLQTYEGSMNTSMESMFREMWPGMSPDGATNVPDNVMAQVRMKLMPGMQEGEVEGSLHDAVMKLVPDMKMDKEGMKPGNTPIKGRDAMLKAWREKARGIPPVRDYPMDREPALPAAGTGTSERRDRS